MAIPAWVGMVTIGAGIPYAALYADNSILAPLAPPCVNLLMMFRSHGAVAACWHKRRLCCCAQQALRAGNSVVEQCLTRRVSLVRTLPGHRQPTLGAQQASSDDRHPDSDRKERNRVRRGPTVPRAATHRPIQPTTQRARR